MTLSALGIFSAAGAGGVQGDYELIASSILGSSQSSIVFDVSSFASTYKHLQIRYVARSTRAGNTLDGLAVRFNADTGTNYSGHFLRGNGSAVSSGAETSISKPQIGIIPAADSTANVFGSGVADFLDPFSSTKHKTFRSLYGMTSQNFVALNSGLWRNTNAITSITIFQTEGSNNLLTGSRFSLYGIRG